MGEFKWGTKKAREEIIKKIDFWAKNLEATVTLLGEPGSDFAPAIVGVTDNPRPTVIYSYTKVLLCLQKSQGFAEDEAMEWYEFNTVRGIEYLRAEDNPPLIITELDDVLD